MFYVSELQVDLSALRQIYADQYMESVLHMTCAARQHGVQMHVCASNGMGVWVWVFCIVYLAGPNAAHWPLWSPTQPQFFVDG